MSDFKLLTILDIAKELVICGDHPLEFVSDTRFRTLDIMAQSRELESHSFDGSEEVLFPSLDVFLGFTTSEVCLNEFRTFSGSRIMR